MNYVEITHVTTPVNISGVGVLNGYKLKSVLHGGRVVSLTKNDYYYIPKTRQLVSYRGTKAKVMTINEYGKYNFQEKLAVRGVVPFKVDAAELHSAAFGMFG